MTALIIGSGIFCKSCLEYSADIIICADGGYNSAKEYGVVPDIVLGDMDSVKLDIETEHIVYPCEKNETDSEIAIDYALKKGCNKIIMAGFTGTRLDHTLNNIFLLEKIHNSGAEGIIVDENNEIFYLSDKIEIIGNPGDFVSVIPVSEKLEGISNEGFKYPLFNETLYFSSSRGISNQLLGNKGIISIKRGKGIVIKSRD